MFSVSSFEKVEELGKYNYMRHAEANLIICTLLVRKAQMHLLVMSNVYSITISVGTAILRHIIENY